MYSTGRPRREMAKARRIVTFDPFRAFDSRAMRSPVKLAAATAYVVLRVSM